MHIKDLYWTFSIQYVYKATDIPITNILQLFFLPCSNGWKKLMKYWTRVIAFYLNHILSAGFLCRPLNYSPIQIHTIWFTTWFLGRKYNWMSTFAKTLNRNTTLLMSYVTLWKKYIQLMNMMFWNWLLNQTFSKTYMTFVGRFSRLYLDLLCTCAARLIKQLYVRLIN